MIICWQEWMGFRVADKITSQCKPGNVYIITKIHENGFDCCPLTDNRIRFNNSMQINFELLDLINFKKQDD